MNAQRHVVKNVWKGVSLTKHPLIVTPLGDKKDRKEASVGLEKNLSWTENLHSSWAEKFSHPNQHRLQALPGLKQLFTRYRSLNDHDFDGRLQASDEICAICEDNSTPRLDLFPLRLGDEAVVAQIPALKTKCPEVPKPITSDVCVQTDAVTPVTAEEVSTLVNKLRGNVENELGNEMAEIGLGQEALNAWTIAAESGSVEALYNLAMCYSSGDFVSRNISQAIYLWEKASSLGHALSTYQLAVCYINGLGHIAKNSETGNKLMEKSAEAGCPDAQFHVASRLLLKGQVAGAEKYLIGAIRKKTFLDKLNKWLKMDSVPLHVKEVIERVIQNGAIP